MLNGNKSISRFLATQIDRPSPVSVRNASSTDRGKHWNHLEYPKLECLGGVFFFSKVSIYKLNEFEKLFVLLLS